MEATCEIRPVHTHSKSLKSKKHPLSSIVTAACGYLGGGRHTTIQDFALGHENEMVEELGDVGVGLVYRERDRAALRSDVLEGSDDGNRNLRVQPAGGLI